MLKKIILKKLKKVPETMLILGSGINEFVKELNNSESISYNQLFNLETDTSIGHKGVLHIGYIDKQPLLVLEGRKHYYEDVSDKDMRVLIQSFASIGVKNMIVTNSCGGMNPAFSQGDIMLIKDHINMTGRNPLVGPNNYDLGPRFVDMTDPYDLAYRNEMDRIASRVGINLQHGVYVAYLGPSYETKAEIKAFRILGGDVVGMSTVPEVILARHAGIKVLGLSVVTNMSTGISKKPLSHEEVLETSQKALEKLSILIKEFLKTL